MTTADSTAHRSARPLIGRVASHDLNAYLFLGPWLLGFIVFTLGPVLVSLYLSFTKFDLLQPPVWIGADNYVRMFTTDYRFYQALKVTFTYLLFDLVQAVHERALGHWWTGVREAAGWRGWVPGWSRAVACICRWFRRRGNIW